MKEHEQCKKKWAITDLNTHDIPFQSQESEQDGRHHFVAF